MQPPVCPHEAAQTKNFTLAAENLFLSRSGVSCHIRELEMPLSSRGFSGSGTEPTEAGEAMMDTVGELLRLRQACTDVFQPIRM